MVQGKIKSGSVKQQKKNCQAKKNAPTQEKKSTGDSTRDQIKSKIDTHQKRIYKSIESRIIERAKHNRETFELLKK